MILLLEPVTTILLTKQRNQAAEGGGEQFISRLLGSNQIVIRENGVFGNYERIVTCIPSKLSLDRLNTQ